MIFIDRTESNPYFNIAAEEFVLRNINEDVLMLWESKDSVVLGKHQNAYAELNYPYLIKNRIPVIRRISGGGTVFHGPGNLNITIIKTSTHDYGLIDFKEFTRPLIDFLSESNIDAKFEGKNNLTIDGLKFSGNSAHIFKKRVLHHGTILFDVNLDTIDAIINESSDSFKDKAVKSIRANVTNLRPHLSDNTNYLIFKEKLKKHLFKHYNISEVRTLTKFDKNEILQLMQERYKSWDWNFGYSPMFTFENEVEWKGVNINCTLKIKNAIIQEVELLNVGERKNIIEKNILNKKFSQQAITSALNGTGLSFDEINVFLKLFQLA